MTTPGTILENRCLKGSYFTVTFYAPEIASTAQPGQFVHVLIPQNQDRILRRPFSIYNVDEKAGTLSLVYKVVGSGTEVLSSLKTGDSCDVLGPLGRGFPAPAEGKIPVMAVGGFGSAATYLLAKRSAKSILLLGARTQADVILTDVYAELGNVDVRIATEDGSAGTQGRVTDLLLPLLEEKNPAYQICACGPEGMLYAVGRHCLKAGVSDAALSLDQPMCCGVGACFGCVVQVRDDSNPDGWRYARSCSEGPVFRADALWYGKEG